VYIFQIKYTEYIFQIKYTEAITSNKLKTTLGNCYGLKLSKRSLQFKTEICCVICYNFRYTFVPCTSVCVESATHDGPEGGGEKNEHDREDDCGDQIQLASGSLPALRQVSIA